MTKIIVRKKLFLFNIFSNFFAVFLFIITISISACKKNITSIEPADDGIIAVLISGTWQLKSATYFNNNNEMLNRYTGTTADSVLFLYGPDQYYNIVLTNISSFINGSNRFMNYSIPIQPAENNQKRISTILLSPAWKIGYSDSLFVTFYANTTLVFKVKDSVSNGYEIDSLKKVRGY